LERSEAVERLERLERVAVGGDLSNHWNGPIPQGAAWTP
jgi:hypothetical protein